MSESPIEVSEKDFEADITVIHTGIEDGHGGAAEELTARSAQLNLYYSHVSQSPSEVM